MAEQERARLRVLLSTISRPAIIIGPRLASSAAAREPLPVPLITHPEAAIQALVQFFESWPSLQRADFLQILRSSQQVKVTQ